MRRLGLLLAGFAVALLVASSGLAAYPDRPVKMIVPWAAGVGVAAGRFGRAHV
jgi:tripartite-type tricarboxylate transporter receptor subunit TctC